MKRPRETKAAPITVAPSQASENQRQLGVECIRSLYAEWPCFLYRLDYFPPPLTVEVTMRCNRNHNCARHAPGLLDFMVDDWARPPLEGRGTWPGFGWSVGES